MKHGITLAILATLVAFAGPALAADPTPITVTATEDSASVVSNDLGRTVDIEAIYIASESAVWTNAIEVYLESPGQTQRYRILDVTNFTGDMNVVLPAVCRVPANYALWLTNAVPVPQTNYWVIFRDDADD
jgi:hypothetical protein